MREKVNVTFNEQVIEFEFYNRRPYVEVTVPHISSAGERYYVGINIHIESVLGTEKEYSKAVWTITDPNLKEFVRWYILQNLYRYKPYFKSRRKKMGL